MKVVMTACTLWYRFEPHRRSWDFNHLEDGHAAANTPTPKVPSQKTSWRGSRWQRAHAWLTNDTPPRVVHYAPEEAS